jgi:hypothetical protein
MGYHVLNPVALIVFNRYDKAMQVFESVRQVKPDKLLIIADGPRKDNKSDSDKCKKVRAIFDKIDWDCEVFRNFSDINLGCGKRPATGIGWVFENVESAIILEDDCVPNESFFRFCDENLDFYRNDERIMMVSGTNVLEKWKSDDYSYHFSNLGGIHGWASWRRAWKYYDFNVSSWENMIVKERVKDVFCNNIIYKVRSAAFDEVLRKKGDVSFWDYQWGLARNMQSGLSVVPSVNLIENIGFGADSTHTQNEKDKSGNIQAFHLEFPLKHPPFVAVDRKFDEKMINILVGSKKRYYFHYMLSSIKTLLKNRLVSVNKQR